MLTKSQFRAQMVTLSWNFSMHVTWLDVWESYKHDNGILTRETHTALRHSTYALLEVTKYCLAELRHKYVLLGKLQTDGLKNRFGQYRQIAGGHYHISIRQLYESEGRIRQQNTLPIISSDDFIDIEAPKWLCLQESFHRSCVFAANGNVKGEFLCKILVEVTILAAQAGLFVHFVTCVSTYFVEAFNHDKDNVTLKAMPGLTASHLKPNEF